MAALLLHRCGHVKDNVHMAGQLWWFQQHLFRRDVDVEQLRDWSLVFFQIPLLVLGSRQTFTVKQPVLWSRVWGDSWPPTSPTRRSTSSHLTMLLFCLRYIYLTVKIHNRNDVIGGVSRLDSNFWVHSVCRVKLCDFPSNKKTTMQSPNSGARATCGPDKTYR